AQDRDAAVGVHPAHGGGTVACAGKDSHSQSDPFALRQLPAPTPQRMGLDLVEHLLRAERWPRQAVDELVALRRSIAATELDGVEMEPLRELVDQRLESKGRLRGARTSIRARARAIRADAVHAHVPVGPPVDAADASDHIRARALLGVRA